MRVTADCLLIGIERSHQYKNGWVSREWRYISAREGGGVSCCLSQDSCETRPVLTVSFRLERGGQFESGFQLVQFHKSIQINALLFEFEEKCG